MPRGAPAQYAAALHSLGLPTPTRRPPSVAEVERAYRRRARARHPDRGGDAADFRRLVAARDLLVGGGATEASCATPDGGAEGAAGRPATVLLRGTACVRDVAAARTRRGQVRIAAATDAGLRLVPALAPADEPPKPPASVLTCAITADGEFVFAGNSAGQVSRHRLGDRDDEQVTAASLTCRVWKSDEAAGTDRDTRKNVVCLDVVDHMPRAGTDASPLHLAVAACDAPLAAALLRFRRAEAEVLWRATTGSAPLRDLRSLDAVRMRPGAEHSGGAGGDPLRFWLGGSSASGEATLVHCHVCLESKRDDRPSVELDEENQSEDDGGSEASWWWDASEEEEEEAAAHVTHESTATCLGFGILFGLDWSPALELLAAAVGTDVKLLEPPVASGSAGDDAAPAPPPAVRATLTTDHTLYCVRIHAPSGLVAACGAGEAVVVWSLATGTCRHHLSLDAPRQCHLATRCLLSCAWIIGGDFEAEEEEKGGSRLSLVSGGYDGNVTRWFVETDLDTCWTDPP